MEHIAEWRTPRTSLAKHKVLPANLQAAEADLRRREDEWRRAGAVRVTQSQFDQALRNAQERDREFQQAKAMSRPSVELWRLRLVRLLALAHRQRYGTRGLIGVVGAIIVLLSLLMSLLLFASWGNILLGTALLAGVGAGLTTGTLVYLWPDEVKRQAYHRLQQQWKDNLERVETLRPIRTLAWADYQAIRQHWDLCQRLEQARKRRDDLITLLASVKSQLIQMDWRSLRDKDFERFLARVFEVLGYHVQMTKASGDQGADLIVNGKGARIAIQTKGYEGSVGNDAVQQAVASMAFYQCTSCAVITNSRFSRAAIQLAIPNGCRLIDGAEIPDLIEGRIY